MIMSCFVGNGSSLGSRGMVTGLLCVDGGGRRAAAHGKRKGNGNQGLAVIELRNKRRSYGLINANVSRTEEPPRNEFTT
jgi:hypothetical protein